MPGRDIQYDRSAPLTSTAVWCSVVRRTAVTAYTLDRVFCGQPLLL